MDTQHEITQAITIFVGLLTTVIGAWVVRAKAQGNAELKRIDVSSAWQAQMLQRISAVETELREERARGDQLENEARQWRAQAGELEWELKRARTERFEMNERVDKLGVENTTLRKQNVALVLELQELNRQIRGGFQGLSVVPPAIPPEQKVAPPKLPQPPKLPKR